MLRFSFLSFVALAALATSPAVAEDKAAGKAETKTTVKSIVKKVEDGSAKQDAKKETTPITEWIDAENALIKPLSAKDQESFFILRNKYSVIRVIRVVERDIGNAVKSCGEKNPDIKDQIGTRFKQWRGAVLPIVDTAEKQLNKDLEKQTLVDVKKAREVFKLNDNAYEYGEKQTTKQVITTKEACENLLESMDDTEDQMISLLKQILLPESVIRQQAQEREKAEAASGKKDFSGQKEKSE